MKSPRIFLDCTSTLRSDLNTGIQRVERNLSKHIELSAKQLNFKGYRIFIAHEHLYLILNTSSHFIDHCTNFAAHLTEYRRFRRLIRALAVGEKAKVIVDKIWQHRIKWFLLPIFILAVSFASIIALVCILLRKDKAVWKPQVGDVFAIPGSSWWYYKYFLQSVAAIHKKGVLVSVLIHDLFPISHEHYFNKNALPTILFKQNYSILLSNADLVIANSQYTKDTIIESYKILNIPSPPKVLYFQLGVEFAEIIIDGYVRPLLKEILEKPNVYLAVGTLEPRKNYNYIFDAFDRAWAMNENPVLLIFGRYGWNSPDLVRRLQSHPKYNSHLFWIDDATDGELIYTYKKVKAMIAASIAEGFGLPLIEALHFGCQVLASDIPVFKEVCKNNCIYFNLNSIDGLSQLICSQNLPTIAVEHFYWPKWEDSALQFYKILLDESKNSIIDSKK